jgi:hypothetical protein
MPNRFDQFGKDLVSTALETCGPVVTDVEVPADPRKVDLWFMPEPTRDPVPAYLGLLARLLSGPSALEFFHNTPNGNELAACVIKHGMFRHRLSLRKEPPPLPILWVISSGRPKDGIEGLWLRAMNANDWPPGIYEGPPLLWTRLVVVSELHPGRDTLLLRLLGADRVLNQAIAELKALEADAPERTLALPILLRLRLEISTDPAKQTSDDQEFLMHTQDIVETFRQQAVQEGVDKGIKQGIEQGIVRSLIDVYEARFGTMPEELRAVIEDTHDEPTLRAWLRLAGTRGENEIAAAIRAVRAS